MVRFLSVDDCEVDILRSPFNRSNKFSINIFVGGHSQSGKTTLIWYMANRIIQLRRYGYRALDPMAKCNTWHEWNGYKNSATTPQKFVELWNNNKGGVITLSEASTNLYYLDWMSIMGRVFNSSTTVLGKQHIICFIDTCMESELMKKARDKMDYRIELHYRDDKNLQAHVRSGWTLIDYLGMKWKLIRNNTWIVQYNKKMMAIAKKYTDWVERTVKDEEAKKNEMRVGLLPYKKLYNPTKPISDKNMPDWVRDSLNNL